jgi:hypothetical protein
LEIGDHLIANIQIEQIPYDAQPSIEISGDENLVHLVKHNLYNERLTLSASNRFRNKNNDLIIKVRTNDLRNVQAGSVGSIRLNSAFAGDEMAIIMKGVGNFYADSLYVNALTVRTEGVGSATVSGKSGNARFETAGVGKINAFELLSDTIYAKVEGVGAIDCNPVEFLEGNTYGIGSITYKEEPGNKHTGSFGLGKIKKR